jgi:hypothetical protein
VFGVETVALGESVGWSADHADVGRSTAKGTRGSAEKFRDASRERKSLFAGGHPG